MSKDTIYRQAAIDSLGEEPEVWCGDTGEYAVREQWRADVSAIKAVPSAEPESCDMCDFCDGLESGDKLFQISDWDGGIGFDYIYIKYCPMCGRRL